MRAKLYPLGWASSVPLGCVAWKAGQGREARPSCLGIGLKNERGLEIERIRNIACVTHSLFAADPSPWMSAGKGTETVQCPGCKALVTRPAPGLPAEWVARRVPSARLWQGHRPHCKQGGVTPGILSQADVFHRHDFGFALASGGRAPAKLLESSMGLHKGLLWLALFCGRFVPAWGGSQGSPLPGDKAQ